MDLFQLLHWQVRLNILSILDLYLEILNVKHGQLVGSAQVSLSITQTDENFSSITCSKLIGYSDSTQKNIGMTNCHALIIIFSKEPSTSYSAWSV